MLHITTNEIPNFKILQESGITMLVKYKCVRVTFLIPSCAGKGFELVTVSPTVQN